VTILETLKAAREVITLPEHHTTRWYARDAAGNSTGTQRPNAVAFCLIGALLKVRHREQAIRPCEALLETAAARLYPDYSGAVHVNDKLGHAAALALYDKAIELAEADIAVTQ
jgi:hypothetical protein